MEYAYIVPFYFDFYNDPNHMICDKQVTLEYNGILKKNFLLIFDHFKVISDKFFVFPCNGIYDLHAE